MGYMLYKLNANVESSNHNNSKNCGNEVQGDLIRAKIDRQSNL